MMQGKSTLVHVANLLAMDINTGVFQPGAWLKQVELAERYECTRRCPPRPRSAGH